MADVIKLATRLSQYPDLQNRVEKILDIVDNTDGSCTLADDAESRVIEEFRKLGKEVLQDWAKKQHGHQEKELKKKGFAIEKAGKKNFTGIRPTEK